MFSYKTEIIFIFNIILGTTHCKIKKKIHSKRIYITKEMDSKIIYYIINYISIYEKYIILFSEKLYLLTFSTIIL